MYSFYILSLLLIYIIMRSFDIKVYEINILIRFLINFVGKPKYISYCK